MNLELCDINVRTFMRCLRKDYTGVSNWQELYTKYIDLSGIGDTRQYGLMVAIHNLNVRLTHITAFLEHQIKFFNLAGFPFEKAFDDVKKYGHRVNWNPAEPAEFLNQLKRIETKEKRNYAEREKLMQEFKEFQGSGKYQEKDTDCNDFIRMLNGLNKHGYRVDKDTTFMDELSLMIKEYNEELRNNDKG